MQCELCAFESDNLEEVSYYDINGNSYSDEQDIERNAQNPDALAHQFCGKCAEIFNFDKADQFSGRRINVSGIMTSYGKLRVYCEENYANLERVIAADINDQNSLDSILSYKVVKDKTKEKLLELDVRKITGTKNTLVFNKLENSMLFDLILEKDNRKELLKLYIIK